MKIEFDGLTLVEVKMLTDVLIAFRANQPFSWFPPGYTKPELVKEDDRVKTDQTNR